MSYIFQSNSPYAQQIEDVSLTPLVSIGTIAQAVDLNGNWGEFIYLRAPANITKNSYVNYNPTSFVAVAAFSKTIKNGLLAQAVVPVSMGYYGWFMLRGALLTAPFSSMNQARGIPAVTFNSLNDVNAGFSSGSYDTGGSLALYSPISIKMMPAASGGLAARATVDLTGALGGNAALQQFDYNKNGVIGVLVKVLNPAAFTSNGAVFMYITKQTNRIQANWFTSGGFKIDLDKGGWFFLTLNTDRNGFVELNGVIQQGFLVDGNSANNLVNSAANMIDSVRFDVDTAAINNTASEYLYIDSLWVNPTYTPTLMIMFDDGYASQYAEAATYMASKGLKGTMGVVRNQVGRAGYLDVPTFQKLYDAGWDLINHTSSHLNAGVSSANSITGGGGAVINAGATSLTGGSIGTNVFDQPRHINISAVANEQGRPFTIVGLGEFGQAQTDVLYGKNADIAISNTVWTQITSITNSSATATAGNVQIGTSCSYNELYADYAGCKEYLRSFGWTRGSNLAIAPNGIITNLLLRAFSDLGIVSVRGVSNRVNFAYPNIPGYNPMNIPAYGGGGSASTAVTMTTANDIYNSAGSGAFSATSFTPSPTIATWGKYIRWKLVINAGATTADISDMDGNYIGTCSSGVAFTRFGVTFTFTVGTSVAGDAFYINIGSNLTTVLKETIKKKAVCSVYLHNILPANAGQGSLDTYRSDFRTFIDEVANDVQKGRVICPTFSNYFNSIIN